MTCVKGNGYIWLIFCQFLQGKQLLCLSVCFPAHQSPSEKGSTPKGEEQILCFLQTMAFQKGSKNVLNKLPPLKVYPCFSAPIIIKFASSCLFSKSKYFKAHSLFSGPLTLTLVLLNKLRCQTLFKFSANQITSSRLLISIHILNGKQCRSRSVGFFRSQLIWIYTVCKGWTYAGSAGPRSKAGCKKCHQNK